MSWRFKGVPLTEPVDFKTRLQMGNRFQLPKLVRWRYKLECDQVLRVKVSVVGSFGGWESFYARMDKSGRIAIPALTRKLLDSTKRDEQSLVGSVLEIRLEPA
jgi:hypothetical protein